MVEPQYLKHCFFPQYASPSGVCTVNIIHVPLWIYPLCFVSSFDLFASCITYNVVYIYINSYSWMSDKWKRVGSTSFWHASRVVIMSTLKTSNCVWNEPQIYDNCLFFCRLIATSNFQFFLMEKMHIWCTHI